MSEASTWGDTLARRSQAHTPLLADIPTAMRAPAERTSSGCGCDRTRSGGTYTFARVSKGKRNQCDDYDVNVQEWPPLLP